MLYLYLGYLVCQLYSIFDVFSKNSVPPSAILFSLVVLLIWSFIPILGYQLAKSIGALGQNNKVILFTSGIIIALVESSFSYFNLLSNKQHDIGTLLVFSLFFIVAFLPQKKGRLASS